MLQPAPLPNNASAGSSFGPENSLSVTHTLLKRFYSHVTPLRDLLSADSAVLQARDSDAFKRLVEQTIVASTTENGISTLRVEPSVLGDIGMRDVLEQVHTRIFSQHARVISKQRKGSGPYSSATPKNVLALGFRPATGFHNDRVTYAAGSIPLATVFANSTVKALRSSVEWQLLLTRIGPSAIIALLSSPSTALFTPLPNACYLQISGVLVSELRPLYLPQSTIKSIDTRKRRDSAPRKRKRRRKSSVVESAERSSEDEREPTVEATPPPPTPSPAPRTPLQSPVKRLRTLGPSISAPQLMSPDRRLGQSTSLLAPLAPGRTALRSTQSGTDLLGEASKRSAEMVFGPAPPARPVKRRKQETLCKPNEIVFARHRMYHARPSRVNPRQIAYGLGTKHVLTRLPTLFPDQASAPTTRPRAEAVARHLAKYVFPRQFGLHNVFTSPKSQGSYEVLPDYENRELDIKRLGPVKTPPRLKSTLSLLQRMAQLQAKCKHRKLLDFHCPSKVKAALDLSKEDRSMILELVSQPRTQMSHTDASIDVSHSSLIVPLGAEEAEARVQAKPRCIEYICSPSEVESFVKAVVREVIPRAFWGSTSNADLILGYITSFLRLRRFEFMTLHMFLQRFCIADCDWLRPESASRPSNFRQRPNEVEMTKRRELLYEFIFWLIDGFVIPLVRTSFYITDSATHQNRALFFRQDDWDRMCAPLLRDLGQSTFERIPESDVADVLRGRELGFSYVRLLPKATGVRPIVNLARRPLITGPTGRREVGKTINKILQSTFDVLTFERHRKPELVGSLVASPRDIYARLKAYKQGLPVDADGNLPKLYFVKVDVQAAYDTIKQEKLLEIVEAVLTENSYWVQRYAQVTPALAKVEKKFKRLACPDGDLGSFSELASSLASDLHNALLSDQVVYLSTNRDQVMSLLREHITTNLVKIGPRLFRQKDGIPQGSVLSSLLCSLFYGDMEANKLTFTKDDESLLLRYVDDFIFISTQKPLASRFLRVMDEGQPDYGCYISTEKRLTNFDIALQPDELVVPLPAGENFPWCGLAINTETLDVKASTATHLSSEISDKLTVQRHKKPGQSFVNTMLRAVKIRSHVIYNDTSHNSLSTVYLNIYQAILVVALKFQAYVREWGADPRAKPTFFIRTIHEIVKYAFAQLQSRARAKSARDLGAECRVKRSHVYWLGYHAFHRVLSRRPAVYLAILRSLEVEVRKSSNKLMAMQLEKVVSAEENSFAEKAMSRREK